MQIIKREVYQHLEQTHEKAENEAVRLTLESFQTADFAEGVSAILQKRPPSFPRLGARSGGSG
jgi:enoyl-CoA hydratase/carnithine racemase